MLTILRQKPYSKFRNPMTKNSLCALFVLSIFATASIGIAETPQRPPNVLFISIDDLRPELGCYGDTVVKSPNIDKLASRGTLFEKAYCMVPVCGASRSSLMTSIRPRHNRFVGGHIYTSREVPNAVPMHVHFKNHGYTTINNGKIFHFADDSPEGWSEPAWRPRAPGYALQESLDRRVRHQRTWGDVVIDHLIGPAWEYADVEDNFFADGRTLEKSLVDLRRLAEAEEPFFLAVGFLKPHLPFVAPKRYWDLYSAEDIKLPENFDRIPENAPRHAIHPFNELRAYVGIPDEGPIPPEMAKKLIHGYYACVSYVDALIGRLLDELDELGLSDNTIVVLWSDHGFFLGEHTLWCKHAVFELAMRVPLIFRLPGQEEPMRVGTVVEYIDIYPTLCELAGLPEPQENQFQGRSIVPLLRGEIDTEKRYAIGRYVTGDTIFDGRYRYSEFRANRGAGDLLSRMLYDHYTDPRENVNIVDKPEKAAIVEELARELNRVMQLTDPW